MATHIPQIRIISYNPMTMESEGRLADFFAATSERADIIMLQGTGTKDYDGEGQPKTTKCGSFRCLQWGWTARSLGANKSCGVMILFNSKRFPADSCSKVFSPKEAYVSASHLVPIREPANRPDTAVLCRSWAISRIGCAPPHLAKTDRVRGHQRGMHKGRGKLFREMMERQRLHAASGHYHGTHGNSSTIDFVILPQSYAESIRAPLCWRGVEGNFSTLESEGLWTTTL